MDLFETFDEHDVLYQEIEALRTSMHKLRRKLFRELDELQTDMKELQDENMKLKFALFHDDEEEERIFKG